MGPALYVPFLKKQRWHFALVEFLIGTLPLYTSGALFASVPNIQLSSPRGEYSRKIHWIFTEGAEYSRIVHWSNNKNCTKTAILPVRSSCYRRILTDFDGFCEYSWIFRILAHFPNDHNAAAPNEYAMNIHECSRTWIFGVWTFGTLLCAWYTTSQRQKWSRF